MIFAKSLSTTGLGLLSWIIAPLGDAAERIGSTRFKGSSPPTVTKKHCAVSQDSKEPKKGEGVFGYEGIQVGFGSLSRPNKILVKNLVCGVRILLIVLQRRGRYAFPSQK